MPEKKQRKEKYDPKLAIDGTLDEVVKLAFKGAVPKKKPAKKKK